MNLDLRTALLAASEHGADRLSVEADRRLRRRLGLESARTSAPARRPWLLPALAAGALAAIVVLVIWRTRPAPSTHVSTAALVDISQDRWQGTLTADAIDVGATSAASATVAWSDARIIATPGTRLATRTDGGLALAQGAIQIQRPEVTPLVVDVPMGRVVIASHHSSIAIDRDSVTILLDDGSGHYADAAGQEHPLVPGVPLLSPPHDSDARADATDGSNAPSAAPPPPTRTPRPRDHATGGPDAAPTAPVESSGPPGLTVPRRPDLPCTYKSDCDPGATCRKNEDGESVCMGHGAAGAACWFDSDCQSNSCSQRRCR